MRDSSFRLPISAHSLSFPWGDNGMREPAISPILMLALVNPFML